jgi:hypothetical protein
MSVAFKELGGSPVEQYGPDGFRARREFLIAWEHRDAFAAALLGTAASHGGAPQVRYPGKSSVFAVRLRYEPFDPDNPDPKALASLTDGLNGYSSSFAKATVEYETFNPRDRVDGPENEIGTHLTYRMLYGVEPSQITAGGWKWIDQPSVPAPSDVPLIKMLPVTDHHLTWHEVIQPPWETVRELQGKVNSGEFLGCPEGTVLFLGAEANKLFRSGFSAEQSGFCWRINYVFRERGVKQGGRTFGWNHGYRADPPGWAELTNGTDRLYDLADFSTLFQSAP